MFIDCAPVEGKLVEHVDRSDEIRVWATFRGPIPPRDEFGVRPSTRTWAHLIEVAGRDADRSEVTWDSTSPDAQYRLMWRMAWRADADRLAADLHTVPGASVELQT